MRHYFVSALVIKKTMIQNDQLASFANIEDICIKIRQTITSKGDQFNTARIDSSIEKYAQVLFFDVPIPVTNAIQRQRGIDSTTHMCGEVLYSATRIVHIPLI